MTYALSDTLVRRVLLVLNSENKYAKGSRFTLEELTRHYDERYPPSRFEQLLGQRRAPCEIERVCIFLEHEGYINGELLSFTDRAHRTPVRLYGLTPRGIQHLASRKR